MLPKKSWNCISVYHYSTYCYSFANLLMNQIMNSSSSDSENELCTNPASSCGKPKWTTVLAVPSVPVQETLKPFMLVEDGVHMIIGGSYTTQVHSITRCRCSGFCRYKCPFELKGFEPLVPLKKDILLHSKLWMSMTTHLQTHPCTACHSM